MSRPWSNIRRICCKIFQNRSLHVSGEAFQEKCNACGHVDAGNLYTRMLKEEAQMNWKYNLSAGVANWILLAGYLVVPGTFTSLNSSAEVEQALRGNSTGRALLRTIQNPPLLIIACILLIVGGMILGWLSIIFRDSYTWLINRVFMPACLNAAAGFLTTLVNVFGTQSGQTSVMALVTFIVTGVTFAFFFGLTGLFRFWKLKGTIEENCLQHLSQLPKLWLAALKPSRSSKK